MTEVRLSQLWRYPVKSLRGNSLPELEVDARGFKFDRQWMLVDSAGRFLTQRQEPRMILIRTSLADGQLQLSAPGMKTHIVSVMRPDNERVSVKVWNDPLEAQIPDPVANQWLSDFLQRQSRLVVLPPDEIRTVDQQYAAPGDQVGFADGFPFLLISQASLDDLNTRLAEPLPMERFRPNLVVEGCAPYAEDGWRRIRIGELEFRVVKPCSRCVIPTIDPETGERIGKEPLQTLMSYRQRDNKVFFGQNLIHTASGLLKQGMKVEVLETVDD